ncbi:SRPBCC domain-containing protein [Paenibacillus tarimensis]
MAGSIFKKAVKQETGIAWETWLNDLGRVVDPVWSNEQIAGYIANEYDVTLEWSERIALVYEQHSGRKPVGVTASAGVQIGVRKTIPVSKEQAWTFLLSPEGLRLWVGDLQSLPLQPKQTYTSKDGVYGRIISVVPYRKIRLSWQRPEWDNPSTLQIYTLTSSSGKTTVSIHQEKLDDLYIREMMKIHWEDVLNTISEKMRGRLSNE